MIRVWRIGVMKWARKPRASGDDPEDDTNGTLTMG